MMSLCRASVGASVYVCVCVCVCVFTSPSSVTFCRCTSFFVPPFQILIQMSDIPESVI